jgi:hypothetical protein
MMLERHACISNPSNIILTAHSRQSNGNWEVIAVQKVLRELANLPF